MEENGVEFVLVLCHDVFLEIIRWGNRRQLVKLERVGKQFQWNVERWFSTTPFLRMDLVIAPSQSGLGLEAKINEDPDSNKKYSDYSHISFNDLENFPPFPFLRFDIIELVTSWPDEEDEKAWDTQSIDAKCQFFEDHLKLIKPEILNDSILAFAGVVDKNDSSRFSDHSELLNYLSDRILPICDKPNGYIFITDLSSEKSTGRCVLTSILRMAQIKCCSNVRVKICNADQTELPVREISNWLHRKCDGHRERSLFSNFSINNALEMFNQLKKAFEEAKSPVQPYTLELEWHKSNAISAIKYCQILNGLNGVKDETIINKATNEQLSLVVEEMYPGCMTIKRGMKKKKN